MQIKSLTLESFRSHTNTEIKGFGRVTAFMGPNGAGKTTTLEMIEGLRRFSVLIARPVS